MRSFFAEVRHVKRDSTLTLRLVQDAVHRIQQRHVAVHFQNKVFVQLEHMREKLVTRKHLLGITIYESLLVDLALGRSHFLCDQEPCKLESPLLVRATKIEVYL